MKRRKVYKEGKLVSSSEARILHEPYKYWRQVTIEGLQLTPRGLAGSWRMIMLFYPKGSLKEGSEKTWVKETTRDEDTQEVGWLHSIGRLAKASLNPTF